MDLDVFPEILRRRAVEVGQVLEMEMFPEDKITPKPGKESKLKRFVVVGKTHDGVVLAALVINSRINEKLFMRIGPYQHLLKAAENDFLTHDSYVNCFTLLEFEAKRVLPAARYLGEFHDKDLKDCIDLACSSPNIKPYLKKKFNFE
jgi:hypothetical protein